MKTQTILKPCTVPKGFHQQTAMRMALAGSKFAGLALALSFLALLTTVSAWGQACAPGCPDPIINRTICTDPVGGGNLCPSVMYRFSTDLTGAPKGDVLNRCAVLNGCLNTLLINQTPTCTTCSGNVTPSPGPTSSPSTITRTIFGAYVNTPTGSVAGLWAYGISGGSFGWDTIDANPTLTLGGPIRSSPGYPAQNLSPYIFVTSESDGALYAFGYTDGVLGWGPYLANDSTDSSPIVTNANEVYIIDFSGYVHKVDGYSGTLLWNAPINSGVYPTGYTSASSISVSNLPCMLGQNTALFVAGNDTYNSSSGDGRLNAYDTVLATPCWSQPFKVPNFPFTSSPVVNESNGLVYVQSGPQYSGSWSGQLIYARHTSDGSMAWSALPSSPPRHQHAPCANGTDFYYSGGSPAYDATPATNYVIAAASVTYVIPCGSSQFEGSTLVAYDAQTGAPKWAQNIAHPITQSSPTVSNGVVYIGTDDGYVLGFDEANGGSPIWSSATAVGGPTGPVLSPPVVSHNRVHWVDGNGTLWVVGICFAQGNCY